MYISASEIFWILLSKLHIQTQWIDIHGLDSEHASIFCLCVREAGRLDAETERITQMPSSPIDGTVEWPALTRQADDDEETI